MLILYAIANELASFFEEKYLFFYSITAQLPPKLK